MNLFNLSLKLKGFPLEKAKACLVNIQSLNNSEFNQHIENSKHKIVSYHLEHNPFYKSFAKDIDLQDWDSIPVISKRDLQQPLTNRLSLEYSSKNIYKNKTSGSSGEPFIFAKDKFCHALTWAIFMDKYRWFNINFKNSKQARFYGIPLDKMGYYKERIKDRLSNRFRFSVFDLSDQQFKINVEKFKGTPFHYINGYTSSIVQFAKYLEREKIILRAICPSLKACIVTSEMLFKEDKTLLEKQFDIPVINEYGSAELGLIAFQSKADDWLVNSEDLFVEVLDDNNKVLPYGQEGRIVITSLFNKAHPFIRYDTGDIGALSIKSTLKKPILERLVGRTNDVVVLPSGRKAAGLTFYYVTKTVIEEGGNVKEFIIEQLNINTFKISYVSKEELTEARIKAIKNAIAKYLEEDLSVVLERHNKLNRSKRGKLKQFTSYL